MIPLKKSLLIILFFAINNNIFATGQIGDRLIIKNDTSFIYSNPLESYLKKKGKRTIAGIKMESGCTALWRGYVATWKIENDSLFLIKIEINACSENPIELPIVKEFGKNKVFAKWVNQEIFKPEGEILDYVHMGYMSIYESETIFKIKKGKLKAESTENFIEYDNSLVFPGMSFLKDTLRSLILNSIPPLQLKKFSGDDYAAVYIKFNNNGEIEEIINENEKPMDKLFLEHAKATLKDFPKLMKVKHERYNAPYFELYYIAKYLDRELKE